MVCCRGVLSIFNCCYNDILQVTEQTLIEMIDNLNENKKKVTIQRRRYEDDDSDNDDDLL
jgi:hypothetical protein